MRLVGSVVTDDGSTEPDEEWLADIRSRVEREGIAAVIVGSLPPGRTVGLRQLSWELEQSGAQVLLAPDLESVTSSRINVLSFEGTSMILVQQPLYTGEKYAYKRILDVLGSGIGLLVAAPIIAIAAIAIWLEDGANPFFKQQRVGVDGKPFTMLKLRSMKVGADAAVAALAASNEAEGPLFKMREDPRITPIGGFLRRYSIDELPRLWNVFRGDMSLVGPRPPLPRETVQYESWAHRRLLVKLGLTGLWQVSGRSDLGWEEGLLIDLSYVENWSVIGDLEIIAKTVRAVFAKHGAY
jgi:exopolysaccharide biosynthesis polyprenyl glycosylphosphotransferase